VRTIAVAHRVISRPQYALVSAFSLRICGAAHLVRKALFRIMERSRQERTRRQEKNVVGRN
jgi:hypothetical protein